MSGTNQNRLAEAIKQFGMCIPEARTIFVHIKKHSAYERLKDTVLRALVYYRFGDVKDHAEFDLYLTTTYWKELLILIFNLPMPMLLSDYQQLSTNVIVSLCRR